MTDNIEYLARQSTDAIRGRGGVLDDPPRELEIPLRSLDPAWDGHTRRLRAMRLAAAAGQ
jgi:hypothetical protein